MDQENKKETNKSKNFRQLLAKIAEFFANPKRRLLFIISLGILFVAICGLGLYLLLNEEPKVNEISVEKKTEEAQPVDETNQFESLLDGVKTTQEAANKHPLAVMIENHTEARPQAGLDKASIVYETVAEGGITRFMALFATNESEKVGPVRSARTYYVDWALGYNAFYAHVGGSADGLEKIASSKIYDLDQFRFSAPYWREYSSGVSLEHTMFANTTKLRQAAEQAGYSTSNNFSVYKFKEEPENVEPTANKIEVPFSSYPYNVKFEYDKTTNSYKRSQSGSAHIDRITKNQLAPKNLIIMHVARKEITNKANKAVLQMETVGSGKTEIFIDGKKVNGTWKKSSSKDREIFYDENGAEMVFNRGQFWICVVEPSTNINVQ